MFIIHVSIHTSTHILTYAAKLAKRLLTISPELPQLMTVVVNKIPNTWYEVGIQLEIKTSILDTFYEERNIRVRYAKVFRQWERDNILPYTWGTLITALKRIGENEMVKTVERHLGIETHMYSR